MLSTLENYSRSNLYTVSGEWSNAITDCAKWLNGRGVGARWDGTWQPNQPRFGSCDGYSGDSSTWSDDYKRYLRRYFESQLAIGEAVQGWTFWTWKVRFERFTGFYVAGDRLTRALYADRPRTLMNGVTRRAWRAAGSRRILRTGCILTFALIPRRTTGCTTGSDAPEIITRVRL